jgi:hypothetical protein
MGVPTEVAKLIKTNEQEACMSSKGFALTMTATQMSAPGLHVGGTCFKEEQ